jgi:hypothetical protein
MSLFLPMTMAIKPFPVASSAMVLYSALPITIPYPSLTTVVPSLPVAPPLVPLAPAAMAVDSDGSHTDVLAHGPF